MTSVRDGPVIFYYGSQGYRVLPCFFCYTASATNLGALNQTIQYVDRACHEIAYQVAEGLQVFQDAMQVM
jgi:hypothetical protein